MVGRLEYVIKPTGSAGYYAGKDITGAIYNRARKHAKRFSTREQAQHQVDILNNMAGYKYYKVVSINVEKVKFSAYRTGVY